MYYMFLPEIIWNNFPKIEDFINLGQNFSKEMEISEQMSQILVDFINQNNTEFKPATKENLTPYLEINGLESGFYLIVKFMCIAFKIKYIE